MPYDAATMKRLTSIVVAVDFTPCSARALREAIRLAQSSGAQLHAVHVIDHLVVSELEDALVGIQPGLREGIQSDAEEAWRAFARQIPGAERLQLRISVEHRVTGILDRVAADHADLLVLGAHGDRPPELGVGSVAASCVRKSPADVLLVRDAPTGSPDGRFRTVVAAVDFSPTARHALARAAEVAHADGAALHVLHVFDGPWHKLHYRAPTREADPHFQRQYRTALEGRLEDFAQPVLSAFAGMTATFTVLDHPGHRSGIVQHAESVHADLIVLGTRGRASIRDLLLGSTAERALAESRCSVLAVKPMADA